MKDFFEDAGAKLKNLVNVVFTIAIVLHCIAAFVLLIVSIDSEEFATFLLGVIGLAISLGVCWLSLLAIAAFADLVIDTNDIKEHLLSKNNKPYGDKPLYRPAAPQPAAAPKAPTNPNYANPTVAKTIYCPHCGKSQHGNSAYCFSCGASLK